MAVQSKQERAEQVVARGEDERTPLYLHLGVMVFVGAVVAIVVGMAFLAEALA